MSSNRSKVTLGGREVTRVGLGTNRLTDTDDNRTFLRGAVEAGIEMIDTAHLYAEGDSETTIGNTRGSIPDSVVVATKGGFGSGSGATRPTASTSTTCTASMPRSRSPRRWSCSPST